MKAPCSIPGCRKRHHAKGYCNAHYWRWCQYGNPLAGRTMNGMPEAYFEEVVLTYQGDECLIWPYARNSNGYGHLCVDGRVRNAHREVCKRVHGPAPTPKHEAAHSCGKGHEGCVTKGHLSWKTKQQNQADKIIHGTHARGEEAAGAKLTAADVHQIRSLKGEVSQRILAERFGVSQWAIGDILRGRRWGWLPSNQSEGTLS